ncbi:MAG TPA: peptidylprolyl isomerase [Candidatus Bipolaricaulota bacterium]|nr:peptidylprolyl isomerase [Candidatus Bipolaricaulota bacterium]
MKKTIVLPIILFSLIFTACSNGERPRSIEEPEAPNPIQTEPVRKFDPANYEDLAALYDRARIKTNLGDIEIVFFADDAPFTVSNFMNLAKLGFYDKTKFHRVMNGFMIQGGDPNSKDDDWSDDGRGNPGYLFKDEINDHKLVVGSLAMANSGANTNGSQFFIVTAPETPWLDGVHTNFGYVVSGMDIVSQIEKVEVNDNDHPLEDIVIENIELIKSASADVENVTNDIND